MDDAPTLIEAFLEGARTGLGPRLYVEGDVLYLDGWWQAAFRLAENVFLVQAEPPPSPTDVVDLLTAGLERRGLHPIPGEDPLVQAVTYAELSVTGIEWTLWAAEAERGQQVLAARTDPDLAAGSAAARSGSAPSVWDHPMLGDLSEEFARSMRDGMPQSVILTVGLGDKAVADLEGVVPDCRVQGAGFDEAVAVCGVTVPHLVIVDASTDYGRRFLLEFRAEACGRHVPVAAVTDAEEVPGADTTLDPQASPGVWRDELVHLLP